MSSIRFAPITGQHEVWKLLGLRSDKTLIFTGSLDPIIFREELKADAAEALGANKIEWRDIDGAHDFPITDADEVVEEIVKFWGIGKSH